MRRLALFSLVRRGLAAACAALLFAGCAVQPAVPGGGTTVARDRLDAFAIEGRFSLRHEDKNYSGRLSWRHQGINDEVLLASPFGQGIAQITTGDDGARLVTNEGKTYTAATSEQLTRQVLGYPLPLARLADWVRGRATVAFETDARGRPLRLRDEAWRIDYEYDGDDVQALPSRLVAQRADGVELRLRIDEWTALPLQSSSEWPLAEDSP